MRLAHKIHEAARGSDDLIERGFEDVRAIVTVPVPLLELDEAEASSDSADFQVKVHFGHRV